MSQTSYKCPNCGAAVVYDPDVGTLKCQHCGTTFDIDEMNDYAKESTERSDVCNWQAADNEEIELGQVSYTCSSCGGQIVMDADSSASECPYCGSPIVIDEKVAGSLKPQMIIPFIFTQKEAVNKLEDLLKHRFFLPPAFRSSRYYEKIRGIYIPYWLFSCSASCRARFRMTRISRWSDADYDYVETSYYLGLRDGDMDFSYVPVDASLKLDSTLLEALEPFDYFDVEEFNPAFLAGFAADVKQLSEQECQGRANERINQSMINTLSSTVIGYHSCILESSSIQFEDGKADYTLMPVYILSKEYKGKLYQFAINGQTGKIAGRLPVAYGKLILCAFAVFFVVFWVTAMILYFAVTGNWQ